MSSIRPSRLPRRVLAVLAVGAAAVALVGPARAGTVADEAAAEGNGSAFAGTQGGHERMGDYDARAVTTTTAHGEALLRSASDATNRLTDLVGVNAMVDVDPLTGTPRQLGSWEGYLTGPSSASARTVVLDYVRAHLGALGLTSADLRTFRLANDYVDVEGTHHLSWTQTVRGVQVFGNGLRAHVSDEGRLIAVQGSPVGDLAGLAAGIPTEPATSAASARSGAAEDVGGSADEDAAERTADGVVTRWANGDQATLSWFLTPQGLRLGWSTYTDAGDGLVYTHVVDADSGAVLYRRDLVDNDRGDAKVYDYYPGAARGGKPRVVNFYDKGWLGERRGWLRGAYVSAWADVDDSNTFSDNELTPIPGTNSGPQFNLRHFDSNRLCSAKFVCTWDPDQAYSWRANRKADVTNAFFLANKFHDWLARGVIGFTPQAGNFEAVDGDPILLHALDGANTDNGLPDANHIDNANMSTPPDGIAPTMQMYLWHFPHTPNTVEPWVPMSGAFDASILYHEYTHGLSNRLVVDADGNSTISGIQAGSMGEAWSDYYAMDFLVAQGLQKDSTSRDGQIREGKYTLADKFTFRTEAMDCDPDSTAGPCTDINGDKGGYTYGDFPTIGGTPEVHASGEVWSQTLWDIRERLGRRVADNLITRGMELSAADPSMLDMRNAIITADTVAYDSAHSATLWRLFSHRGMGWYAGSVNAGDSQPIESFKIPPAPDKPRGALQGLITDPVTGDPAVGASVTITGHPEYTDAANDNGVYRIDNVRAGKYQKVAVIGAGYETIVRAASVPSGGTRRVDFETRRDWAASSGGATLDDFNGPDYTPFGCGPARAIDGAQGTGWGSTTGNDAGEPTNTPVPKFIVVELPETIDIAAGTDPEAGTAFRVDPTNVCGDPGSSSTNEYRIEVSANGTAWTEVADDAFGTVEDPDTRGHYFDVESSQDVSGVNFVRFWMDSPQVPDIETNCPDGAFGGCEFMDMTEIEVFGTATP